MNPLIMPTTKKNINRIMLAIPMYFAAFVLPFELPLFSSLIARYIQTIDSGNMQVASPMIESISAVTSGAARLEEV